MARSFNVRVSPHPGANAGDFRQRWNRNLLIRDVSIHAGIADSEFLGRLPSRISLHSDNTITRYLHD